jgi:hypothetical protein
MSWHRELTTGAVAARFFEQIVQQLQNDSKAPLAAAGSDAYVDNSKLVSSRSV